MLSINGVLFYVNDFVVFFVREGDSLQIRQKKSLIDTGGKAIL